MGSEPLRCVVEPLEGPSLAVDVPYGALILSKVVFPHRLFLDAGI